MGLLKYFLLFISVFFVSVSKNKLNSQVKSPFQIADEVLYLPNGNGLKLISFGYTDVLAHTLWFKTISYFGKHYKSDRNYTWLSHMCNIVTDLNPQMDYVYDFCGLMLAWESNMPEKSENILTKAMKIFPISWKFPYLRGMTYLLFLNDPGKASLDFKLAASLPGSHDLVRQLAQKDLNDGNHQNNTIEFLQEMIKNSTDNSERSIFINKLKEMQGKNE